VLLRPINTAAQRPNIDQIAHNVERLEIVLPEKIQQRCGIAAACAQMRVGDPRGAITLWRHEFPRRFAKGESLLGREDRSWVPAGKIECVHSQSKANVRISPSGLQKNYCYFCVAKTAMLRRRNNFAKNPPSCFSRRVFANLAEMCLVRVKEPAKRSIVPAQSLH